MFLCEKHAKEQKWFRGLDMGIGQDFSSRQAEVNREEVSGEMALASGRHHIGIRELPRSIVFKALINSI